MRKNSVIGGVFDILKGVMLALGVLFLFVLVFAFVIKTFSLPSAAVPPAVYGIKSLAVILSAIIFSGREKGLIKGAIIGGLFLILANVLSLIISGENPFSAFTVLEVLLGALMGGISGVIGVNVKSAR